MTFDIISILSSEMLSKQFEVSTNACDWSFHYGVLLFRPIRFIGKCAIRGEWWSATVLYKASFVCHVGKSCSDIGRYRNIPKNAERRRPVFVGKEGLAISLAKVEVTRRVYSILAHK